MKFEETKYNLGDKVWLFKRDVKEYRCPCCGGSKHRTTKVYVVQVLSIIYVAGQITTMADTKYM